MRTHPAEEALYRRVEGLKDSERRRVISRLDRLARPLRFHYVSRHSHPLSLVPVVLERRVIAAMQALTRAMFRFQMLAPGLYRGNTLGFADIIRLERRTAPWFAATGGPATERTLLVRPDYGFRSDGSEDPLIYESNSLMLGSLYLQPLAQQVFEKAMGSQIALEPAPHLLDLLERWLRRYGAGRKGVVAFLENWPPQGGFSELPQIAKSFRKRGYDAQHADPRHLELVHGEVRLRGRPVVVAYRDFSFEDVGGPGNPRMGAFRRLWEDGKVVPGFGADFDQKGTLECMTSPDFEGLFTRREVSLFRRQVPWTRVVRPAKTLTPEGRRTDLPDFVRKFKDRLVLKPSWSSGGEGILIGRTTRASVWERRLAQALQRPGAFAVQEYFEGHRRSLFFVREGSLRLSECRYTIGVFHDGEGYGYACRVSPKEVVNVARGGALAPIYLA